MPDFQPAPTLSQLLDFCSSARSPHWEAAWREFIARYKTFIYAKCAQGCRKWNVARLQRQFNEVVHDVVAEVLGALIQRDGQALRAFRERDDEGSFRSYLATICQREAGAHIVRYFLKPINDGELEDFRNLVGELGIETRWALYEALVATLRGGARKRRRNIERDITLFLAFAWADFSAVMISSSPCTTNVDRHLVEVVVNRMRGLLREAKTF